ncbi:MULTISPECIES: universal stress protein [Acidianus]|uniref:Universal stress protein UspA n=1 Tax=Candidatus Acidianus copahuensis TaxID=1160895 RepID=A0A031LNR2_9CREN|nr:MULTISPECIES: universal stress protein [Acidianus]EZQ03199.1 universal stress protein UspA [Candidatus Acidianus copahuensis]NON61979.1 universal stress protein [Acidianus sp. RZ1]
MFNHILVAYDGSEHAKKALEVGIDLAKKYNAKLEVVEVVDTAVFAGAGIAPVPADVIDSVYNRAKADIEEAKKISKEKGIDAEGVTLEGEPASAILEYSSKNNIDLIVTGSRGLSAIKRIFLGSVSSRIVQEAKVPVLVIKK